MQITETIFNYNPATKELEELTGEAFMTETEYEELLTRRSAAGNTSVDYEKVVDLEELFSMRKDKAMVKYYADLLETEFSEIRNRHFNE